MLLPLLLPCLLLLTWLSIVLSGAWLLLDSLAGLRLITLLSRALLVAITAVNGVAEELFFRGAAYAAITRHPVLWTTIAYAVATLATGNVMLCFAAVLLGAMVGLERRATGGILAPILTHCTWSLTMLLVLPLVFS